MWAWYWLHGGRQVPRRRRRRRAVGAVPVQVAPALGLRVPHDLPTRTGHYSHLCTRHVYIHTVTTSCDSPLASQWWRLLCLTATSVWYNKQLSARNSFIEYIHINTYSRWDRHTCTTYMNENRIQHETSSVDEYIERAVDTHCSTYGTINISNRYRYIMQIIIYIRFNYK